MQRSAQRLPNMKVITLVTTVSLDESGKPVSTPPGVVDLPDNDAKDLLKRGQAKKIAAFAEEEKGPSVKIGTDAIAAINADKKSNAEKKAVNISADKEASENKKQAK